MDKSIYEVERDEFVGFIAQIKKDSLDKEIIENSNNTITNFRSKLTDKILCSTEFYDNDVQEVHYYIYELPENDERCAPPRIAQYHLETKEEVQAFFDIINKIQKGEIKND